MVEPFANGEVIGLVRNQQWNALEARLRSQDSVIGRCLSVARSNDACCALLETGYDDFDYRSEFAGYYARRHLPPSQLVERLHFFRSPVDRRLRALPQNDYLGYLTLCRWGNSFRVGATMLTPPPEFKTYVLTVVDQDVELFGHRLHVSAVPFAQQDGQYTVCSHMASWLVRRIVGRRFDIPDIALGDIAALVDGNYRPSNSSGLRPDALVDLLESTGLRARVQFVGELDVTGAEDPADAEERDVGINTDDRGVAWIVHRQISSGCPVVIGASGHAFVLIGVDVSTPMRSSSGFCRHDDLRGPYLRVANWRDDTEKLTGSRFDWTAVITANPQSIWLTPETAEIKGRTDLRRDAADPEGRLRASDVEGAIRWRTFLRSADEIRSTVEYRKLAPSEQRLYRLLPLPKHVWVTEAHDVRRRGPVRVVGEALVDPQSSDLDPVVLVRRAYGSLSIADQPPTRTRSVATISLLPN